MSFNPRDYDIENWLRQETEGLLQKECNIFDEDGLLVEQFKTRVNIVPVGFGIPNSPFVSGAAPSLHRQITYDDAGNPVASLPEIREWTVQCEELANGTFPDDGILPPPINRGTFSSKYEYAESLSVPSNTTVSVYTKQLQPDEVIYLRHVIVSGENIAKYQVCVNGQPIGTKRTWYTKFNEDFFFKTSNGGILYKDEELIEVKVTNRGDSVADFETSVGIR